jgi:acetyl esterase
MRSSAMGLLLLVASASAPAQSRTFVYKQTPQRPLQLMVDYPGHWRASDRRAAIVFFFGSWRRRFPNQFEAQAKYFSQRGMVAIRPDFRVYEQDRVEPQEAIEDGRAAFQWVHDHAKQLGVDPLRIVAAGPSDGGQIAACLVQCLDSAAIQAARPAALILFNPRLDVADQIGPPNPNSPFQGFPRLRADKALQNRITPLLHVKRSDPPTLVLTGTKVEGFSSFTSSKEYVDLLRRAGVRAELDSAANPLHGSFNASPWRERTLYRADVFLGSLGIVKGRPVLPKPGSDSLATDHPIVRQLVSSLEETEMKVLLALEEMPAESYSFQHTPREPSFRRIAVELADVNDRLCSAIPGIEDPDRDNLAPNSPKEAVIDRVKTTFDFCRGAFTTIDAVSLNDDVGHDFDLRNEHLGPPPPMSRAGALLTLTQRWASAYSQLVADVRLNGRIPPVPCTGEIDKNCAQGENLCHSPRPSSAPTMQFILDDNRLVTSDGKGPYRLGESNVITTFAGRALVLVLGDANFKDPWRLQTDGPQAEPPDIPVRSIRVDLSQPVPSSISKPLGIVVDSVDLEVAAQMQMDPDYRAHTVDEIPVGASVKAAQADVQFHIGGVTHVLQFGPQPTGHCFSDGTSIDGTSTSQATITRSDETTWSVDLPAGSVGRLYDVHLGYPHAIDRGLYYSSFHFVVRK